MFGLAILAAPSLAQAQMLLSSDHSQSILPTGVEWNKPLKAGDMVLPTRTKLRKRSNTRPRALNAPKVGSLQPPTLNKVKAPQLGQPVPQDVIPPKLAAETKGADSLMLLQGLKSMLNMSGDTPDVPKSANAGDTLKIKTDLKPVPMPSAETAIGESFVSGQEPKSWVAPGAPVQLKQSEDGMMDIIFPSTPVKPSNVAVPTVNKSRAKAAEAMPSVTAPKATDLMRAPKPLAEVSDADIKAPKDDTDLFGILSDPLTSIFGSPVEEDSRADIFDEKTVTKKSECEPSVTEWLRECSDAGYPAHYVGKIVGETRVECPQGDARDVWLSNSCAAPVASSPMAIQETTKLDIKPEELTAPKAAPIVEIAEEAESVYVPPVDPKAVIDASCGTSNGMAMDREPIRNLCSAGTNTAVFGDGPWRWSCKGQNGGMTVSCASPVTLTADGQKVTLAKYAKKTPQSPAVVADAKCGISSGKGTMSKPVSDLCETGAPSFVNGAGPWTWACSGVNGGKADACVAPKKTQGICGRISQRGVEVMPAKDLCREGYASAVNGSGPWYWTCSGLHGGDAATCQAFMKTNAVCGDATAKGHREAPESELCHTGLAANVTGEGPWNWSCEGANGGASVACEAEPLSDGTCGAAHGNQFTNTPEMGLCDTGRSSRVTGFGPWRWSCAGEKGGITVSCTASKGTEEEIASVTSCGGATETIVLSRPTDDLCRAGDATDVKGKGPWTWDCMDKAGHKVSCATLSRANAVCGKAKGEKADAEPTFGLCDIGSPSSVLAEGKKWSWKCDGVMGGKATSCTAPRIVTKSNAPKAAPKLTQDIAAQCGSSADQSFTKKPAKDLCQFGKSSSVKGKGPWTWSCGSKKVKVSCEAEKLVHARCGDINGSIQRKQPTSDLCGTGTATAISGKGPWIWSCVGSGGGESVSCSATSQSQIHIDGTCGAAANALMTTAPNGKLCDTGRPSKVYGEGPWTWTCSGANGGIATTCATMKVIPKAPPPPGPLVNGDCGSSNGVAFVTKPRAGYCDGGVTSALSGSGPWNWSCLGENGGMTVSCTAPLMPPAPIVGSCGQAHGTASLTKPRSSLCEAGISSAVSGKGPWVWSCSGTNGGGAVSCVAPMAGKSSRPQPSLSTPSLNRSSSNLVTPQLNAARPAMKPGVVPTLRSSKLALRGGELRAPKASPSLPVDLEPITVMAPDPKVAPTPREGLLDPVRDEDGNIVKGTELVLDPETSTIYFDGGSDRLDDEAVEIAARLARILRGNATVRLTFTAYSDTGGVLSPRKARKLSLNRGLAVRNYLAAKGIPNTRVDVKPKGANVPSGDMDRVDIKIN